MSRAPLTQLAIYGVFLVVSMFISSSLLNAGVSYALVLVAVSLIQLPLFAVAYAAAAREKAAFPVNFVLRGLLRGLLYYAGVLVFWAAYLTVVGRFGVEFELPQQSLMAAAQTPLEKAVTVLIAGLVGPVLEEGFFRGALFGVMRANYGFLAGAFITSVLFGLAHGVVFAIPMFVFSWLLCYLTETTQSLDLAIALHIVNNVFSLAAVMR